MVDLVKFLKVAKDFGFKKLSEQCANVLKDVELDLQNIFSILGVAELADDTQLEARCVLYILR
jgi:hypothetical protein